jgi:chromate transporter
MSAAAVLLVAHIALLSLISFGGVPGVLPDLRDFVVITHGWISNQDFANCFAIVQALPGPNMILLMALSAGKSAGCLLRSPARLRRSRRPACSLTPPSIGGSAFAIGPGSGVSAEAWRR